MKFLAGIESKDNIWHVRQRDPNDFSGGYATYEIREGIQKVDADLKGGKGRATQTLLFDKDVFPTEASVRAWINSHEGFKIMNKIVKKYIRPEANIQLAKDKDALSWNEIAREGTYYDIRYGEFQITAAMLKDFKKNFEEGRYLLEIDGDKVLPVDYGHEQEEAAGWIKALRETTKTIADKTVAVLEGGIKFVDDAIGAIKKSEYKFFSPMYDDVTDFTDYKTGEKFKNLLLGGALTNIPVIDGMAAITLSRTKQKEMKEDEIMDAKEIAEMQIHVKTLEKESIDIKSKLDATGKELEISNGIVTEKTEALDKNTKELEKFKTEAKEKEVKELSDKLVKDERLLPADIEKDGKFAKLCEKDLDAAKMLAKHLEDNDVKVKVATDADGKTVVKGEEDGGKELSNAKFDAKVKELCKKDKELTYDKAAEVLEAQGYTYKAPEVE